MISHLIVGLGNPGREYRGHRHNVGMMAVDRLAARYGAAFTRHQAEALITPIRLADSNVLLAKPQTYMNESGRAVAPLLNFYKLPADRALVCFDDLDLPLGTQRLRAEGSSGGQGGMTSIIERAGTQAIPRLRLGIGRPPGGMDPKVYVLQDFTADECAVIEAGLERAADAIECFIREGIEAAMNTFNGPVTTSD